MAEMVSYVVGAPWPHPLAGDGLQAIPMPTEDGLDLTLVAAVPRPTPAEVHALTRGPLRLGVLPAGSLVGIIAAAKGIELDAPYAPGLAGAENLGTISAAAGQARGWPDGTGRLLTVAVVDLLDCQVRGLRAVSLSRQWWTALADAIAAASTISVAERDVAMRQLYLRYPRVLPMLQDCAVVERAGIVV